MELTAHIAIVFSNFSFLFGVSLYVAGKSYQLDPSHSFRFHVCKSFLIVVLGGMLGMIGFGVHNVFLNVLSGLTFGLLASIPLTKIHTIRLSSIPQLKLRTLFF